MPLIAALVLAGCASRPKEKTEVLDTSLSGLGINDVPDWVVTSQTNDVIILPAGTKQYKDSYCFVAREEGEDKQFLEMWATAVGGQTQVAQYMRETTARELQFDVSDREGDDEARKRIISDIGSNLSNVSYQGLQRAATYWQKLRNRSTKKDYYVYYALFVIDKKILNDQIAQNLQHIVDSNAAMSDAEKAIYADLIAGIRSHGLRGE
jgi:hypothetical protein